MRSKTLRTADHAQDSWKPINKVRRSNDLLITTLEFDNEEAGVIRLAQSFNDVTATTELAVGV